MVPDWIITCDPVFDEMLMMARETTLLYDLNILQLWITRQTSSSSWYSLLYLTPPLAIICHRSTKQIIYLTINHQFNDLRVDVRRSTRHSLPYRHKVLLFKNRTAFHKNDQHDFMQIALNECLHMYSTFCLPACWRYESTQYPECV